MYNHTSKKTRRLSALFIMTILLFSILLMNNPPITLALGSEPSIKIGSCQIAPDQTAVVAITGQNIPSPGLAGYQMSVQYDAQKLEILGIEKSASNSFSMQLSNVDLPGIVKLAAIQTTGAKGAVTFAQLRIKAKASAVGSTALTLTIHELVLADLKPLQVQVTNGQVEITTNSSQNPQALSPLSINIVNLPIASINQAYSYTLKANNGTSPYVWSASSLPTGLTMNAQTGMISGIPSAQASSSLIQISVSDSQSPVQTVTAQLVLEVAEPNLPTPDTGSTPGTGSTPVVGAPVEIIPPQPAKVYRTARLSGMTAAQTAIAIAEQTGWKTGLAILASSEAYGMVDALTAGPLATYLKAPILLTESGNRLNADTKAELVKLEVKTVYVTSGTGVISQAILNELTGMGIKVESLGGADRFATSANIAQKMVTLGAPVTKVAVAYGWKSQDALSIASIAAAQIQPILLTEKDQIPASVKAFLTTNSGIKTTDVIGGTGVISNALIAQLPSPTRHSGNTAYDTNTQVIKNFDASLKYEHVYLANGETAIDALAGVPLAALTKSAIILTDGTIPAAATFVNGKLTAGSVITALGGTGVVTDQVLDWLGKE